MDNDHIWNLISKKLAGEASPDDLKELESALRLDPGLHYSLEALQDMWKKHAETEPQQTEIAFQKHMDRLSQLGTDMGKPEINSSFEEFPILPRSSRRWRPVAFILSGIFLIVIGFYFFNGSRKLPIIQKPVWEVVTQNGTKTNLLLPDGSTVWLNAGSRLSYDSNYGINLREVTLSGEAYFDVVKNPKKPFIIHTGKINIRVLGTLFNVKSYPGEKTIETSLIKGSIEVSFPSLSSKKIILKPNQKLVIDKTEPITSSGSNNLFVAAVPLIHLQHLSRIGSDSAIVETGWMQNRLYFGDMSFPELLKNMERKYGVSFQLSDTTLNKIHFTGSFQNESVTQALDALRLTAEESTEDFTYEMQGKQVFIYNNTTSAHSNQP